MEGDSMSDQRGFNSLSAAAHALKGAEASSMRDQINFVSDALLQGRRVRRVNTGSSGLPDAVCDVLENIQAQVAKAKISSVDLEEQDYPYEGIKQDLEILEKFTDKVTEHYKVADLEISKKVKTVLLQTKAEALSLIALCEIFKRVQTVETRYRNDPQMSPDEYKDEIKEISQLLISLEDRIFHQELPENCMLKERLLQVKNELTVALELSTVAEHPGITGGTALNLMHMSAEMVQQAKTLHEVQEAADMATEARQTIKKSGKHFQESGLFYEKLIQEVIAFFVNKRIRELEIEVKKPVYFIPTEVQKNEKLIETIRGQKEKLLSCHHLADEWGGLHKEDLEERIALIYERVDRRAKTMKELLLEETKKNIQDSQLNSKISSLVTKLTSTYAMGKEEIKPERIFAENEGKSSA
jgi:hypothetical protein